MQKLLPLLASLLCVGPVLGAGTGELRVLTWNIHRAEGMDQRYDLDRIASVIQKAQPDLIVLQEVDKGTLRSKLHDQPAQLAKRLPGYTAHFFKAIPMGLGEYGCCLMTRWPVQEVRRLPLAGGKGHEDRVAGVLTVEIAGRRVLFAGTHLDHMSDAVRSNQLATLLAGVPRGEEKLSILAGDFNAACTQPCLAALAAEWRVQWGGPPGLTFPADQPQISIDHVFVRSGSAVRAARCEVLAEPVASDHRPVLAVLEW